MNNARLLREGLEAAGLEVFGGVNAPYCVGEDSGWHEQLGPL